MGGPSTFEEVLDAALRSVEPMPDAGRRLTWPPAPPVGPWLSVQAGVPTTDRNSVARSFAVAAPADGRSSQATGREGAPFAGRKPSSRPTRRLLPRHQHAVDSLNALGADLGPDFTIRELRSAFRLLARRHHPDRHAGSDRAEQDRRSRIFARATDHYHCLLDVVRPRGR